MVLAHPKDWQKRLRPLNRINWKRTNARLWEGRALLGERVSKAHQNIILTANAIKNHLKLPLSPEEQRVEDAFNRERHAA